MIGSGFLLTEKQRKILALVAEGWNDERIARFLNISPYTVRNTMVVIKHKLASRNRTHSVMIALRRQEIFIDGIGGESRQ